VQENFLTTNEEKIKKQNTHCTQSNDLRIFNFQMFVTLNAFVNRIQFLRDKVKLKI